MILVRPIMFIPVNWKKGSTRKYDNAIAPRLYPVSRPRSRGIIIIISSAGTGSFPIISAIRMFACETSNISLKIIIPKMASASFHVTDFLIICV